VVQLCAAEQLLERHDEVGIQKRALLPIVNPDIYLPRANKDILEMAQRYPDRFIPFCNIDPRAEPTPPKSRPARAGRRLEAAPG